MRPDLINDDIRHMGHRYDLCPHHHGRRKDLGWWAIWSGINQ
jgi:hypothetical protein